MFKNYMKFILENSEKKENLKNIILLNKNLINKLKKNKNYNETIGGEINIGEYNSKIEKFKNNTIEILNGIESKLLNQEQLVAINNALKELIKYHELLSEKFKDKDLIKIKSQLAELKKIIEIKIGE